MNNLHIIFPKHQPNFPKKIIRKTELYVKNRNKKHTVNATFWIVDPFYTQGKDPMLMLTLQSGNNSIRFGFGSVDDVKDFIAQLAAFLHKHQYELDEALIDAQFTFSKLKELRVLEQIQEYQEYEDKMKKYNPSYASGS